MSRVFIIALFCIIAPLAQATEGCIAYCNNNGHTVTGFGETAGDALKALREKCKRGTLFTHMVPHIIRHGKYNTHIQRIELQFDARRACTSVDKK